MGDDDFDRLIRQDLPRGKGYDRTAVETLRTQVVSYVEEIRDELFATREALTAACAELSAGPARNDVVVLNAGQARAEHSSTPEPMDAPAPIEPAATPPIELPAAEVATAGVETGEASTAEDPPATDPPPADTAAGELPDAAVEVVPPEPPEPPAFTPQPVAPPPPPPSTTWPRGVPLHAPWQSWTEDT